MTGKLSSASAPESMKKQLLVKSKMEDPEVQKQRQEIVNTRTVAELSEVHGFGDFPIPTTLERLVDKSKRQSRVERYFMMELYEIDSKPTRFRLMRYTTNSFFHEFRYRKVAFHFNICLEEVYLSQ